MIQHYTECPVCGHTEFTHKLTAEDHTVSHEKFAVISCNQCGFLLTQDVPDQNNIGKYYQSQNYISHSDTNQGLFFKLYKWVRSFTLAQKKSLIHSFHPERKNLLDVGCGTGYFLHSMKSAGWTVTGLEPSETARNIARQQNQIDALDPSEIYTFPENKFDVITLWHVLEHVHDLNGYFQQFYKILKPGGYLFIAVPYSGSADARQFGKDWAAWDVPIHLYHFTPDSIQDLCKKHRLNYIKNYPMWFDAFYVSMLSREIRKQNKWIGIWDGLKSNIHALTNKRQTSSLIYVIRK